MHEMSSNRLPFPISAAMRLNEHFSTDLLYYSWGKQGRELKKTSLKRTGKE